MVTLRLLVLEGCLSRQTREEGVQLEVRCLVVVGGPEGLVVVVELSDVGLVSFLVVVGAQLQVGVEA